MAELEPRNIRNIVLAGHPGGGKTSLGEALLFKTGVTKRLGSVPDKTSVLDHHEEEREKQSSHDSAVCHLTYGGCHVNIVDAPGMAAFCGPAIAALGSCETAVIVISAASGIQVNTRKMFQRAKEYGLGVWVVINHIDAPNVELSEVVASVQETFGAECVPLNLPSGGGKSVVDCFKNESGDVDFSSVADAHTALLEAIVGSDEALMEKYLGGELSDEEAVGAASKAVADGELVPILFTDAIHDVGITEFLDALPTLCPSPDDGKKRTLVSGETETELVADVNEPFVGQVFKISTDAKSHIKYLSIRVFSGKLTTDMHVKSHKEPKGVRPGQITRAIGADHSELESGVAGDIITLAKLDFSIGDVIYDKEGGTIAMPALPMPMFALALESKSHGDADKINAVLKRFAEEDPCFSLDHSESGEMVVHGVGELQIRTYLQRMAKHHKLEVDTKPPRIPYRETITSSAKEIEYTHKKQSGGSGQFGRVIINVLPAERGEGYEFVDKIFGGSIDQAYRPSVDKGVRAQMAAGVLAGYPVVDVKVELIDGKTHPVDSKDIAFQIAGRGAFREGFMKAKPVLLEPIVDIEVTVPSEHVGDIQGDLASRRGRPQGQEILPGNFAVIKAVVPLAEVADYNSRLSSITGGQGSYTMELSHYENVPGNVQQQIIEQHKKEMEEAASAH